jgi:hypothetical protein
VRFFRVSVLRGMICENSASCFRPAQKKIAGTPLSPSAIGSLERRRAIEILFLGRQRRWARTRVNETLPDLVEHKRR